MYVGRAIPGCLSVSVWGFFANTAIDTTLCVDMLRLVLQPLGAVCLCVRRLVKMKTVTFDTVINSASLHESGDVFVAGGHDFKMYKYDYGSGKEIGKAGFTCLQLVPVAG